jgi:hypothetical protein
MTPSSDLTQLQNYYLEDSFVLEIEARPGVVTIRCELVLKPSHPRYHDPLPGEQNCYELHTLVFKGVKSLEWDGQGLLPAVDANDEADFGGFDSVECSGTQWRLQGNWGVIRVQSSEGLEIQ